MAQRIKSANVKLKRAHEPPAADDGTRILIDRLWPRGISKGQAALDEWVKEVAPSTELRKWFGHDPEQLARLRALARRGPVTLVFSARDERHNDAVVLRDVLLGRPP